MNSDHRVSNNENNENKNNGDISNSDLSSVLKLGVDDNSEFKFNTDGISITISNIKRTKNEKYYK